MFFNKKGGYMRCLLENIIRKCIIKKKDPELIKRFIASKYNIHINNKAYEKRSALIKKQLIQRGARYINIE
jgi:hypothetical protein